MRIATISIPLALTTLLLTGCGKEPPRLTTSSPKALQYYSEGVSLYDNFYFTEAEEAFARAIREDSAFAMAWARSAVRCFSSDDEREAKENIEHAISLAPRATERERLFISMWNHLIHYDRDRAMEAADSIIERYPDETEIYVFKGRLLEHAKNLDRAIQVYQRALQIDSNYAPAVMSLGYAYSTAGEQERAIAQMQRYIRLVPDAADPRASYADLLFRVGKYAEALRQYEESLKIKPDYWYAHSQIGRIYLVLGRLTDARGELLEGMKVMQEGPSREASVLAVDAGINVLRGEYRQAVDQFRQAFEKDSMNYYAAYGIVSALSKLGEYERANAVVDRIGVELERRNLNTSTAMLGFFLIRAQVLTEQGRLDEAREMCDNALAFSTPLTRTSVFRQLAEIELKEKSYDAAFMACDEALRLNPNHPEVLFILTELYKATNDVRMTHEIGGRLLTLWQHADPDFQKLIELRNILGRRISAAYANPGRVTPGTS
jgi:tetratricopeptide (TPR) repeat protein